MKYYIIKIGFIFICSTILSCSNQIDITDSNENAYKFLNEFIRTELKPNENRIISVYGYFDNVNGLKYALELLEEEKLKERISEKTINYLKEGLKSNNNSEIIENKILSEYINIVFDKSEIKYHLTYISYPILSEDNKHCIMYMNVDYIEYHEDFVFLFEKLNERWVTTVFLDLQNAIQSNKSE